MCKRKTTDEYKNELALKNPSLELLSIYTGNHNKVDIKCKKCGYIFISDAASLLQGHECKKCAIERSKQKQRKTHETFIAELSNINNNIEVLDKYVNSTTKIKVKCKICNHVYMSTPQNLLAGYGCIECFKKLQHKTHNDFVNELYLLNPNIKVIGKYKNNHSRIKCQCIECNYIWSPFSNRILQEYRCPKCSYINSYGEEKITNILDKLNISYTMQQTFDDLNGDSGKSLRCDFYIKQYNMIIEYNGRQHYEPIEVFGGEKAYNLLKKYDRRKQKYALKHNIKLLIIPYLDFDNIEKILDKELNNNNFEEAIYEASFLL